MEHQNNYDNSSPFSEPVNFDNFQQMKQRFHTMAEQFIKSIPKPVNNDSIALMKKTFNAIIYYSKYIKQITQQGVTSPLVTEEINYIQSVHIKLILHNRKVQKQQQSQIAFSLDKVSPEFKQLIQTEIPFKFANIYHEQYEGVSFIVKHLWNILPYERFKTLLIYGQPGSGKNTFIESFANEVGAYLVTIDNKNQVLTNKDFVKDLFTTYHKLTSLIFHIENIEEMQECYKTFNTLINQFNNPGNNKKFHKVLFIFSSKVLPNELDKAITSMIACRMYIDSAVNKINYIKYLCDKKCVHFEELSKDEQINLNKKFEYHSNKEINSHVNEIIRLKLSSLDDYPGMIKVTFQDLCKEMKQPCIDTKKFIEFKTKNYSNFTEFRVIYVDKYK